MLPELHALKEVQLLDMSVRDLDGHLANAPTALEEVEGEIQRERGRLEAAEAALEENGRTRRKAEGELQEAESQVEKFQEQLLNAGSNLEYSGLVKQIEGTRKKIGGIEERIIVLMDDEDRLGAELARARETFAEAEKRLEAKKERIRREAEEHERERDRLKEDRARAASALPAGLMEQYERIRRARHGVAVARVRGNRCIACNVVLRPQVHEEVRAGSRLLICEACGRILYFEAEEQKQPA